MVTTPTAPAIHPHVRGADRDFPASDGGNERFIPTCVGQDRLPPTRTCCWTTVHPHVRGADRTSSGSPFAQIGSSPRAWGRCGPLRTRPCGSRFIPTCVGQNPISNGFKQRRAAVHPHVRGADGFRRRGGRPRRRFTPTCVGQILSQHRRHRSVPRFIPRAWGRCGPLRTRAVRITVHPHVRGADVKVGLQFLAAARFIPTCVGQMRRWNCRAISICGSSPRAWGRCCG